MILKKLSQTFTNTFGVYNLLSILGGKALIPLPEKYTPTFEFIWDSKTKRLKIQHNKK